MELKPVPTTNVESRDPSVFNLAILFDEIPLYDVKNPPTIIFPSDWIDDVLTIELNPVPILNDESYDPSVFNLTILFDDIPLYDVNCPPTIIFPSDWIEEVLTIELNPVPILNNKSISPKLFVLTNLLLT